MDYEVMVKEAYEEIMGLDKEAQARWKMEGVTREQIDANNAARSGKSLNALANRSAQRVAQNHVNDRAKELRMKQTNNQTASQRASYGQPENSNLLTKGLDFAKNHKVGTGVAAGLALAGGTALALKKHHDKKKEQAEKAAAYYDEAQLVKEAAEADYAEACAYEEAALAILNQLGYLD